MATVAACVRRFCLECVGASSARGAFDCLSGICPLYPANPFRGRTMPRSLMAYPELTEEERSAERRAASIPRRRPSIRLIHAYCRDCQPGDRTDCGGPCALYPFRPWDGPGKAPRPKRTEKQATQLASARARSPLTISRRRGEKPSTRVGAALHA
jgi:hypothetical protein